MLTNIFYIFFLSLFWLIIAGLDATITYFLFSIVSVALCFVNAKYLRLFSQKTYPIMGLINYVLWLLKEIGVSACFVTKLIWTRNPNIKPIITYIDTNLGKDSNKIFIYANSITLTPGTLSIDTEGEKILIHSLTTKGLRELISGGMVQKILSLN